MDYEDLRRVQRAERSNPELSNLPADFYSQVGDLIKRYRQKCEKSGNISDVKLLENIIRIARDVFERREAKIVMHALREPKIGEAEPKGLTDEERSFFAAIRDVLRANRVHFDGILSGEVKPEAEKVQRIDDLPSVEAEKKEQDLNTVLVRIIKKVPRFVDAQLREWGPFEVNELVRLPRREAELLSSRQFVEIV